MASYMTPEEVTSHHVKTLGPKLGPVYDALYHDCSWLQVKWHQYVELFASQPKRLDLLNRVASGFFRIVHDTFLDDTLLHLSRLTDRPGGGIKENLTIQNLPALISDATLRSEVEALVEIAVKTTAFAHDWRNRRIAHRDLAIILKKGAKPLAPASRKQIKDALHSVCRVLEHINGFYFGSDLRLELAAEAMPNDALSLLYVIRDGLEAEEQRRRRIREGKYERADLKRPGEL